MITRLEIINPDQLVYQNDLLVFGVLGGIKLEGLDRLRVTLKVEIKDSPRPPVRHNLDLYNDNQLEKFIRKCAERLEIGTNVLAASLSELTEALEKYRLEQIQETRLQSEPVRKQLSEEEQQTARSFLEAPELLERTNALIGESGVIGEELNRLIMYLVFTSRKREQPLHVVSLGSSGTGKTHLQEKVGELIPEEDKIEITTLSENAFYYFGQRELKNKLILIEDLDGAQDVLYPLRELQSKKRISKTIAHKNTKGETRTVHLIVEGPVSVSGCTTRESLYEDNANRSFLLYLDESAVQDERIMQYQRLHSAGKIDTIQEQQIRNFIQNCQRVLEPVKVINPYAGQLKIPAEVFKPRRSNAHYLAFIEAVTFYHQYQRTKKVDETTGEQYIETTLEDIEASNRLLKEILLRKSDELTGACRNYFERLKQWLKAEHKTAFTNTQARTALRENHSNQKRYMLQLQYAGLIRKGEGDRKKGYYYEVVSMEEYEQLKAGISGVLDEISQNLAEIKESPDIVRPSAVCSPEEVHRPGELLNPLSGAESTKKFSTPVETKGPPVKLFPEEGAGITYKILCQHAGRFLSAREIIQFTGRSDRTERRHLKTLGEAGLLEQRIEDGQYKYSIKPL